MVPIIMGYRCPPNRSSGRVDAQPCRGYVFTSLSRIHLSMFLSGTYTVATGTTYEAESGTISGSATLPSNSAFSGGKAVGFLGS